MAEQQNPPQLPTAPGAQMGNPTASNTKPAEDKGEQKTPPSRMNKQQLHNRIDELEKGLDERSGGLDMREAELEEREARLADLERRLEGNPGNPAVNTHAEQVHASQDNRGPTGEREPRPSMAEGDGVKGDDSRASRRQLGTARILDADFYVERYPDKQLMWINDVNGEVNRWIDAGAEPVPVENRSGRTFEGINDSFDFQYVRAVGGTYSGQDFWVYLLMMDPSLYDHHKLAPIRERQRAINEAMYRGRNQSGGGQESYNKAAVGGMETYAPQLPTGGQGLQQTLGHHENIRDAI